jgi:hypothetical protein
MPCKDKEKRKEYNRLNYLKNKALKVKQDPLSTFFIQSNKIKEYKRQSFISADFCEYIWNIRQVNKEFKLKWEEYALKKSWSAKMNSVLEEIKRKRKHMIVVRGKVKKSFKRNNQIKN